MSNFNTGKTILKINVEDSNDYSPEFEYQKYSATIKENSIKYSLVEFIVSAWRFKKILSLNQI